MIKRVTPEPTPFEKYFVFEAPRKSNVRVLKTAPDGRYRDYTRGADAFDAEDEPEDDTPTEDDMDLVDADDTDYTDDADDFGDLEDDDPGGDEPDTGGDDDFMDDADLGEDDPPDGEGGDAPDTGDDAPDTGGDDFTDGADLGDDDGADAGDAGDDAPDTGDEPDTGDDTDFTDGADGDTGDESNDDAGDDDSGGAQSSKSLPDQLKAYNLYNKYLELYEAIKRYISKLDSLVKDSMDANLIIRTASSNLRELEDLVYDYMLYQYQSASYTKSLIFYEKMLLSVRLVFKMLENINVNDESEPKH